MYLSVDYSLLAASITKTEALDLDLSVPASDIELAKQTTTTRVYLDFKVFTSTGLTSDQSVQIFNVFGNDIQ